MLPIHMLNKVTKPKNLCASSLCWAGHQRLASYRRQVRQANDASLKETQLLHALLEHF